MEEELSAYWSLCRGLDVSRMERGALGWLQTGCLRLYRLGLLYPWTLPEGTDLVSLHGRARAVAWRQDLLSCDLDLPLAERAGHAAGLLGCYVRCRSVRVTPPDCLAATWFRRTGSS